MASLLPPQLLSAAIVGAMALRVRGVWDELPRAMASHYGPSGQPDAYTSPERFFVLFASIGGGVVLLIHSLPWLLHRIPSSLINLPHRDYWLAPERRRGALHRFGIWLSWYAVALTAFLAVVLELVLRANLERAPLANGPFLAALGAFLAATVALVLGLYRSFRLPGKGI